MQNIPQISLKAARINASISQKKAAEMLGISQKTLQNYETGKTFPDVLLSRRIEALYKFPIDNIFFGTK